MILPKPIRKMIGVFRGAVSAKFIMVSVALGLWFGLMPGKSGIHFLILAAALILNIHFGLFLMSAGIGAILRFAAAPILYWIGSFIHDYFGWLLNLLSRIPIVGLTDFDRYSLVGSLIAGPIIGLALGLIFMKLVTQSRKLLLKVEEGSQTIQNIKSKKWVRAIDRILIGKSAKDIKSVIEGKSPLFNKVRVVAALVILAVLVVGVMFAKNKITEDYAAGMLTKANGAEVDIDEFDLSFFKGSLQLAGIAATDPEKPTHNRIYLGNFDSDMSMYSVLCGRLVVESAMIAQAGFDVKRESTGIVTQQTSQEGADEKDGEDVKIGAGDIGRIEEYFKDAKKARRILAKVSKLLKKSDSGSKEQAGKPSLSQLEYLRARAETNSTGRILFKKLKLKEVDVPMLGFGLSDILMINVSDVPSSAPGPVSVSLNSLDSQKTFTIALDFTQKKGTIGIKGSFDRIDLKQLRSQLDASKKVFFQEGVVSGVIDGGIIGQIIDIKVNVKMNDLKINPESDLIKGLDKRTTTELLKGLSELETQFRIYGPVTDARIDFQKMDIADAVTRALTEAGKSRINEEIDKQLKDIDPDNKLGIKEVLDKNGGLLKSLFGDKKKSE